MDHATVLCGTGVNTRAGLELCTSARGNVQEHQPPIQTLSTQRKPKYGHQSIVVVHRIIEQGEYVNIIVRSHRCIIFI